MKVSTVSGPNRVLSFAIFLGWVLGSGCALDAVSGIEAGVEAENVLLAEAHGRREEVGEVSWGERKV